MGGPRAPSPGSQDDCQDSRDSFTGSSQDGYSGFPPSYNNYPAGDPRQGPPQQHPGMAPGTSYPPNYPQGQGAPPGQGYPPTSQPGYPGYPGGNSGGPQQYPGGYPNASGPPGSDPYRGGAYGGYPPRPGYPGAPGGPPTSGSTPPPSSYPPSSQPYEQYQGPGAHPVILRANSPATPGTIQDTLPPALPVQRIPNPHVCNASSTAVQQRVEYTLPLRCDKCYIHVVWVCFTLVLFLELLPLPLKPSSAWLTSCVTGLLWQRVGPKW